MNISHHPLTPAGQAWVVAVPDPLDLKETIFVSEDTLITPELVAQVRDAVEQRPNVVQLGVDPASDDPPIMFVVDEAGAILRDVEPFDTKQALARVDEMVRAARLTTVPVLPKLGIQFPNLATMMKSLSESIYRTSAALHGFPLPPSPRLRPRPRPVTVSIKAGDSRAEVARAYAVRSAKLRERRRAQRRDREWVRKHGACPVFRLYPPGDPTPAARNREIIREMQLSLRVRSPKSIIHITDFS